MATDTAGCPDCGMTGCAGCLPGYGVADEPSRVVLPVIAANDGREEPMALGLPGGHVSDLTPEELTDWESDDATQL